MRSYGVLLAFSDVSQVIYARVPDAVKDDVEEYAEKQGVSLTSAVVDLVQRGLAAVVEEKSITNLEAKVARTSAENNALEARLAVASNEVGALRSFADRAVQTTVGKCPKCQHPISGFDLLGRSHCGKCGQSLLGLLAPKSSSQPALDERELGFVVGALGAALLGAVVLGSKGK